MTGVVYFILRNANYFGRLKWIFLFLLPFTIQAQTWQWANSGGSKLNDESRSVATDASGNVFIVGYFRDSIMTIGNKTLFNHIPYTSADIFLAKYDASGNLVWAQCFGGTNNDIGRGITADASGNIYITGYYRSPSITFGSYVFTNLNTRARIFTVKLDTNGNVIWARSDGGKNHCYPNDVSIDGNANIYVAGYFRADTIWISSQYALNTASSMLSYDWVVFSYDSAGNARWVKSGGGTLNEEAHAITCDQNSNIYFTGYFKSPSMTIGGTTLINGTAGLDDIMVVSYDSSGSFRWAKSAGGTGDDDGYGIATDTSGNVYLTGRFGSPTMSFDSYTLTNAGTGNTGDVYLTQYNSSGTVQWTTSAGEAYNDVGEDICLDVATGNIIVAGKFSSSTLTFGNVSLLNAFTINSDIFIIAFNPSGTALWGIRAGGNYKDYGQSITADASRNIYITGYFNDPVVTLGSSTLFNKGPVNEDIYVAKIYIPVDLPVEWLSFNGIRHDNDVDLKWSTASEINNHYFIIQRAFSQGANGTEPDWKSIGNIEGAGNSSSLNNYSFTDHFPFSQATGTDKVLYYRLLQTDYDGKKSYSKIIAVDDDRALKVIRLFPNPAVSVLYCSISASFGAEITVTIKDVTGRNLEDQKQLFRIDTNNSMNELTLNISNLPKGVYFVTFTNDDNTIVKKILVG